jgi:hypothetical protein
MNPSQVNAEAVAIQKGRIVHVGSNSEIAHWIGKKTKVISLNGKTVLPGLIDSHVHVADFARMLSWVDLRETKSIQEMMGKVRKRVGQVPRGKWIIGNGWDETNLAEKRCPDLRDLDAVSPDNPVVLYRQTGRVCVVNTKALELAGLTKAANSLPSSEIEKDPATGKLTGVLHENATDKVWSIIPEPTEEDLLKTISLACEKIAAVGVTSVHWIVSSLTEISIIQKLGAENKLPLRIYVIIPANLLDGVLHMGPFKDLDNHCVKLGGVMIFADGFLAARTAALREPYSDAPATKGELLCPQEELNKLVARVHRANLLPIIHAVGDEAIDAALTAIQKISGTTRNCRFRLEQAAVLDKGLIQRAQKNGVTISVQPGVMHSDFTVWSAVGHLGNERARWVYPLKTLLNAGIHVISGSDCPMEPLNPLFGIQVAVTREFFPEERISVDDALRICTVNAAYATFEENVKGSIEEGKLADITVLSQDPRTVPPNEIEDIAVEMTVLGGRVVCPKPTS